MRFRGTESLGTALVRLRLFDDKPSPLQKRAGAGPEKSFGEAVHLSAAPPLYRQKHREASDAMQLRKIARHTTMILTSLVLALSLRPAAAQLMSVSSSTTYGDTRIDENAQKVLLDLLRRAPVLASAVAHDPSLLNEPSYVQRNSPALAAFLVAHPEVTRAPDDYLFINLPIYNGDRAGSLEKALCPQMMGKIDTDSAEKVAGTIMGGMVGICFFGAIAWIIRLFVEGRRQSKLLKAQSELQNRLIDKFGSSQELAAYLTTDAAQKLLGSPLDALAVKQPATMRAAFATARILWPLQIGAMLLVLAVGVYGIRNCGNAAAMITTDAATALSAMMTAAGIGFILCAGIAWAAAKRLGMLPAKPKNPEDETLDRP